jgi:general secretion pathway protein J
MQRQRGFTLVEVLIALVVMSLMAVLTWQGIDGMAKASSSHRSRSDEVATVQTALAQWRTDLDYLIDSSQTPPAASGNSGIAKAIEFDSRVLRLTRRYSQDATASGQEELRVVAWGVRSDTAAIGNSKRWLRWVSPPVRTRGEWDSAWAQAARWGQNPSDADRALETPVLALDDWQLFYYRNDAWTNPQSSDGTSANNRQTPDALRVILKLAPEQQPGGALSIDWVQPTRGGGR